MHTRVKWQQVLAPKKCTDETDFLLQLKLRHLIKKP